ncbi:MAG: fatty acid CoA ligase family protein [Aureliella sp.]
MSEEFQENANVALRLRRVASDRPAEIAMAVAVDRFQPGVEREYQTMTFAELEIQTSSIAAGLQQMGVKPGMRMVMLVKFGPDFISLVFALLKVGAVVVLIDPGMGRKNIIKCLQDTNPDGFVAIPAAQAVRMLMRRKFPSAKLNVTVGPTLGILPKPTLEQLSRTPSATYIPPATEQSDEAAIIFTTGSTGPPKGVLYTHQTFNNQIDQLVERYNIQPGGCDLSAFPLFGLFNAVMGTTTVIPDMDPTRPADVDPPRLLSAIDQWKINQAFGSPALWTTVGRWAQKNEYTTPHLRRVFSAGAPVPPRVLESISELMQGEGEMYTPYGATESLPVASIESAEVLNETAAKCNVGAGTCVGNRFSGIEWKVIAIDDGPLPTISDVRELAHGEIGELMVRGPVVTERYVTRTDQNALHKVADGETVWHRMGDVGYLDQQDRFWCCGRKSHRIQTEKGNLFTEPCEAIFNTHKDVYRTALVAAKREHEIPVLFIETWPEAKPADKAAEEQLITELREIGRAHPLTKSIEHFIISSELPTDIRHNSKIFREKLRADAIVHVSRQG